MRTFTIFAVLSIVGATALSVFWIHEKRDDVIVALIGSFWGFLLSQGGLMIYEKHKQKEELISMLASAKHELNMNMNTIEWIHNLVRQRIAEVNIHGLGFSGVDQISEKAIENLVMSPLTYKLGSRKFVSRHLLSIYQTILLFKREIPTDRVDGNEEPRYGNIKFAKVVGSFELLVGWIDAEGIRLSGRRRWKQLTADETTPRKGGDQKCERCEAKLSPSAVVCGTCGLATPAERCRIKVESTE